MERQHHHVSSRIAIAYVVLVALSALGMAGCSADVPEEETTERAEGAAVATGGLVAQWTLNYTSADSRAGRHLTWSGSPSYVAGKIGGAANLANGTNGGGNRYLTAPNAPALDDLQNGSFSFSAWIRPASVPPATNANNDQYFIVGKQAWALGLSYLRDGRVRMRHPLTNTEINAESTSTCRTGQWCHVVGVVDRTGGKVQIYFNGARERDVAYDASRARPVEQYRSPLRIGIQSPSDSSYRRPFDGSIDQVRVYAKALSASEVRGLYDEEAAASSGGGKRTNFGHYVRVVNPKATWQTTRALTSPGVTGVVYLYDWNELEGPNQGQYHFQEVDAAFAEAKANGKYFVIDVSHRTFYGEKPLPAYLDWLQKPFIVGAGVPAGNTGYCAMTWKDAFRERYKALLTAIGNRYKNDPKFMGVMTGESSLGFTAEELTSWGYDPVVNANNWKAIAQHGDSVLGSARMFWQFNFQPRDHAPLLAAVAEVGRTVVIGGPDLSRDPTNPVYRRVHETQMALGGKVTIGQGLSNDPGACRNDTAWQAFDFGARTLGADYLWWNANISSCYGGIDAVYQVIKNNPTF